MRVLIAGGGTGGHLMPALALAEALIEVDPSVEPVLVGAKRGVEATILPSKPYRYYLLPVHPLYRREWWKNLRWPFLFLKTLRECSRVLDSETPSVALGTGGYASGPVLYWATRRGIPLAIQEQNSVPGLATRMLAGRARQIHLGFPEAEGLLKKGPNTAVLNHGNPITPPPVWSVDRSSARTSLGLLAESPVAMVMGGSQGAARINSVVADLIRSGAFEGITLLWSTGERTWRQYAEFDAPPHRIVKPFWDPISEAYAAADITIARAGAMTTAELCAWGLPSILVPLPTSAADHQSRNAAALAEAGAALHLPESELTPDSLQKLVGELLENPTRLSEIRSSAKARGKPTAARNIAEDVLGLVG